ncbi:hypothetical protein WDZ16_01355 [Pseudokineococcus marinus]|uniref:Uncharacterized protein n=1 Tax=Pseudokineococcus marinus TaxID=351215 RepID=A0A849BK90_9ACTN|nr:hypothetical protein [Pseudokineococcus marinus]NNH21507.1 hypothetical protein [Pseudokineococcus marinus]
MTTPGPNWSPHTDLGDWLASRLTDWIGADATVVTSLVPGEYEAYARVLHPVEASSHGQPSTTWAEVCAATGRTAHPLMQWQVISGTRHTRRTTTRDWQDGEPEAGTLEPTALAATLDVLSGWTAPGAECVMALWDGYGWVDGRGAALYGPAGTVELAPAYPRDVLDGPRLHLPGREYLLFTGPLASAGHLGRRVPALVTGDEGTWLWRQSPNLLWPSDHSWCLATEVDLDSTVVGGPAALVDALLASPALEAHAVPPDGDLSFAGDHVNPSP